LETSAPSGLTAELAMLAGMADYSSSEEEAQPAGMPAADLCVRDVIRTAKRSRASAPSVGAVILLGDDDAEEPAQGLGSRAESPAPVVDLEKADDHLDQLLRSRSPSPHLDPALDGGGLR
jgi:hypothetical protein